jgi:hypothetical protein
MKKRIVVVLVLLALFLASGGAVGRVSTESTLAADRPAMAALEFADIVHLAGPVCYPGDPCGPQSPSGPAHLGGPVCYPGDPCGPQGLPDIKTLNLAGTVCYPGDPCGWPQLANLGGPVCYPGDPCGPQRPSRSGNLGEAK